QIHPAGDVLLLRLGLVSVSPRAALELENSPELARTDTAHRQDGALVLHPRADAAIPDHLPGPPAHSAAVWLRQVRRLFLRHLDPQLPNPAVGDALARPATLAGYVHGEQPVGEHRHRGLVLALHRI